MYHGDDEPTEVLHIYVVREVVTPSLLPIVLSVLALSVFVTFGALSPNQQPVTRAVIRVPAVPLTAKTFTAEVPVIPTGVKVYPATTARGVLTITNGSVISQTLPAGFKLVTNSGTEVATDSSVFVPSGSADGYGYATTAAHMSISGVNLPTLAVDQTLGTSLYIRNLSPFTGGRPAYSVKFITSNDRDVALSKARTILISKIMGLHYPCSEDHIAGVHNMIASWHCQFLTYHIPAFYHVTGVKIIGKNLLIDVWFVARPAHIWVK
jgi:hypothetical protein